MTHVARDANYQGSLTTPVPCFLVFLGGRNQPSGATLKVQLQPSSVLRDISIPMVSVHDCSLMYEDVVDENDSSSKGGSSKQKFQARKTICNIEHTCITYWCNVHTNILRWCVWVSVSNDIKMMKWFGVWKGCGLDIELTSLWNGRKLLQSCRCWKPLCPGRGKRTCTKICLPFNTRNIEKLSVNPTASADNLRICFADLKHLNIGHKHTCSCMNMHKQY